MIRFENVTKEYKNNVKALDNLNLKVNKGDFIYIIGPSGAGKSTLIKLLLKEENATSGKIFLRDKDITYVRNRNIPKIRREVGVVYQDFRLLPNKTVYENVAFAMEILGENSKSIRRKVPMILSLVNLSRKASCFPNELSGGEQQRVSIARSLVNEPAILIADEPTGNLDPDTADEIMTLLFDINKRGTTILMATHAREIVDKFKRRVIELRSGSLIRDEKEGGYGDEAN